MSTTSPPLPLIPALFLQWVGTCTPKMRSGSTSTSWISDSHLGLIHESSEDERTQYLPSSFPNQFYLPNTARTPLFRSKPYSPHPMDMNGHRISPCETSEWCSMSHSQHSNLRAKPMRQLCCWRGQRGSKLDLDGGGDGNWCPCWGVCWWTLCGRIWYCSHRSFLGRESNQDFCKNFGGCHRIGNLELLWCWPLPWVPFLYSFWPRRYL